MHWSSQANSVYDGTQQLKSDVSGKKAKVHQDSVNTGQCIPFVGHYSAFGGSLRMEEEKQVEEEEEEKMKKKQQQKKKRKHRLLQQIPSTSAFYRPGA